MKYNYCYLGQQNQNNLLTETAGVRGPTKDTTISHLN